jgi:hypothetical protein
MSLAARVNRIVLILVAGVVVLSMTLGSVL